MRIIPLDIPEHSQCDLYTLRSTTTGKGRYIRQSSSADSFAIVTLRLEPSDGPAPFQLLWQVTEEQIPEEFIPGVIAGIRQAAQHEYLPNGCLTHITVTVIDGAFHPVDSHVRAYTQATLRAFEDALAHTSLVPFGKKL